MEDPGAEANTEENTPAPLEVASSVVSPPPSEEPPSEELTSEEPPPPKKESVQIFQIGTLKATNPKPQPRALSTTSKSSRHHDPTTILAMKNLGIRESELQPPSEADLALISRDPEMKEYAKQEFQKRKEKLEELIQKEKERLKNEEMAKTQRAVEPTGSLGEQKSSFQQQEFERMQKQEQRNQREARNIILQMLIQQEIIEEEKENQELEKQKAKEREDELQRKQHEDRIRMEEQLKRLEEMERKKKEEIEKSRKEAEAAEKLFREKKAQKEKEQQETAKKIEFERQRKAEKAKEDAKKKELEREMEFIKRQKELQKKELEMQAAKEKKLQERISADKEKQKKVQEKIEAMRKKRMENLENRRVDFQKKEEERAVKLKDFEHSQQLKFEELQKKDHEKLERVLTAKEQHDRETAERKKKDLEKEENTYMLYSKKLEEDEKKRQEKRLRSYFKSQETILNARILDANQQMKLHEKLMQAEERTAMIEAKEKRHRHLLEENEKFKKQMDKRKEEMQQGSNFSSVKGSGQLAELAEKMNLNFEELRDQARKNRRRKPPSDQSQTISSKSEGLPPLRKSMTQKRSSEPLMTGSHVPPLKAETNAKPEEDPSIMKAVASAADGEANDQQTQENPKE